MSRCRALLISAPASGQGKTTVTAAIARLFHNQGKQVRVFKTGPDFIDPMILQRACGGHPVYPLDLWMTGQHACRQHLAEAAEVADLILIEGVMGLFDGKPSSADLAEQFGIPILAVIDSKGMAQTFGAVAQGLASYRPSLPFKGVLANRVASPSHAEMLAESLPAELGEFAWMDKDETLELPSRHLGLFQASELPDLDDTLDRAAAALHLPELNKLADKIEFKRIAKEPLPALLKGIKIGIACDDAFSFIYPANIDFLEMMGAELSYFSPLNSAQCPDVDSLWFPGGYPEVYAKNLSENKAMKESIKVHYDSKKVIFAECGGMLYLTDSLKIDKNHTYEMCGLLSGQAIMQKRLGGLGMQAITIDDKTARGHTFHYSRFETKLKPVATAIKQRNGQKGESLYRQNGLTASYLHLYFPSNPELCSQLFLVG
jgi:cobyrinic acid a,c-diamide synthase